MSNTTVTTPVTETGLRGLIANLRIAAKRHKQYLRTYNELNALSDRDLADLGLSRSMIRDLAREASASAA